MKICRTCKSEKDECEFRIIKYNYRQPHCIPCENKLNRERAHKRRVESEEIADKLREKAKEYYHANKEKFVTYAKKRNIIHKDDLQLRWEISQIKHFRPNRCIKCNKKDFKQRMFALIPEDKNIMNVQFYCSLCYYQEKNMTRDIAAVSIFGS